MKILGAVLPLFVFIWELQSNHGNCERPDVVNVGAVFAFDSVIGRAAKTAMELAVSDINRDPSILNGTNFILIMEDSECSVFKGTIGALQLIEKQVMAIIGPQSSAIAHMISFISNGLQVPLISYAATDPTLSSLQFPFFLRTTQSDQYQMEAVADIVCFYEWKEVIAIYLDDDYGRNGIAVLNDALAQKMSKISYKLPLPINYDITDIMYVLNQSKPLGPRVFVVHINPDSQLRFFKAVKKMNMTGSNHVWLMTDWFSTTLDSFSQKNRSYLSTLEGVVSLRPYIPQTTRKRAFLARWRKLQQNELVHSGLSAYGLYAYDTVWLVARSIDNLLQQGGNISFSLSNLLNGTTNEKLQLGELREFDGGDLLLNILSHTNFTGLTGKIHFSEDRNLIGSGYEVINIAQQEIHTVGYWSNFSGLSILPPKALQNKQIVNRLNQNLKIVTWPGGKSETPRGWVIANDERPLRIGFPRRASFTEFVTLNSSHNAEGYCIDLFYEARKLVPYDVPFIFEPFGTGLANPDYDALVNMVATDVFDAAVGDIAIVTNRTRTVDFTQPYVSTGLVIVAPVDNSESSAWVFLKPFTWEMWGVTALSFLIIAVVIWILEHRVNDDFRGPPKRQITTMFLFSFSTLFKTNQENTVSTLGRMVMVAWLFLLLVITSSYTASLTSILTVQQLSSPITGIDSLIASNSLIGYQVGSFAYSYLKDILNIAPSRLKSLRSPEEFEMVLRRGSGNGGVMAVVDELPYIELFLQNRTDFGIIGRPFTKSGWGFAFKKDSPLATDMSTAILKLAESGKLQEIHEKWFCQLGCSTDRRKDSEPNQLHLSSFWALYLLSGAATLFALLIFLLRSIRQYIRYKRKHTDLSSPSNTRCSQAIYSFFDFIDEKEEAIKRIFAQHDSSQAQTNGS
ncbi:Glutamate receptor 3.7 [Capsicum annuum]|uniref:Glutamate receptor n=3 Tax=Capsicum annuum TaxID=4072 RepID=A0A2G2Z3B4_CAPAN|nr:glutamate receptor 3.7 isoform X1 [Capsicum annuum]KAF3674783.1 Glutamate receptor 3.7 [Capsicum annuum]PHT76463.1 Glutamate receptor 3.7 [Capsicum annuum]